MLIVGSRKMLALTLNTSVVILFCVKNKDRILMDRNDTLIVSRGSKVGTGTWPPRRDLGPHVNRP